MATQSVPAVPSTESQHARRRRILDASGTMLAEAGEDALHMKRVSEQAQVSLATLYRYFPSKEHILLALAEDRFGRALGRLDPSKVPGSTPAERIRTYLLREFRAQQREPLVTSALARVLGGTDRTRSDVHERIQAMHLEAVRRVAEAGGQRLGPQQLRVLPIVLGCFSEATRGWLAGVRSPADARFQIVLACRLVDLDDAQVAEDAAVAAEHAR